MRTFVMLGAATILVAANQAAAQEEQVEEPIRWGATLSFSLEDADAEEDSLEFDCDAERERAAANVTEGPALDEEGELIEEVRSACDPEEEQESPYTFTRVPTDRINPPPPPRSVLETESEAIARENRNCRATATGFTCSGSIGNSDEARDRSQRLLDDMLAPRNDDN